jgi:hypothetical protein
MMCFPISFSSHFTLSVLIDSMKSTILEQQPFCSTVPYAACETALDLPRKRTYSENVIKTVKLNPRTIKSLQISD